MNPIEHTVRTLGVAPDFALANVADPWRGRIASANDAFMLRAAGLGITPAGWTGAVAERMRTHAGAFSFAPLPAIRRATSTRTGATLPDTPGWLDTAAKRAAWDALADERARALAPLIKGYAADAAVELERASADAEFWNRVAGVAEAIDPRTLAGKAGTAVADLLDRFTGPLGKYLLLAAGVGVAFIAWRMARK